MKVLRHGNLRSVSLCRKKCTLKKRKIVAVRQGYLSQFDPEGELNTDEGVRPEDLMDRRQ